MSMVDFSPRTPKEAFLSLGGLLTAWLVLPLAIGGALFGAIFWLFHNAPKP